MSRNSSQLSKELKKVASGIRINSAADDASGYSIAAKMHVLESSLDQDIENVKTGRNLLATAEGGIREIISNIREMKEMVLNAMNDHNTDDDRATIQKVYEKRMETITDIAATTNYNGRLLLNGDYFSPKSMLYGAQSVSNTPGLNTNTLTGLFPSATTPANVSTTSTSRAWASGLLGYEYNPKGYSIPGNPKSGGVKGTVTYKFNFSGANVNGATPVVPTDFDQQGFTMICVNSGCSVYLSVKFDASMQMGEGVLLNSNGSHNEIAVGIRNAGSIADIEEAIYSGMKNIISSNPSFKAIGVDNTKGNVHEMNISRDGGKTTISQYYGMWFYEGTKNEASPGTGTTNPYEKKSDSGRPLIIHHGPKQNQNLHVYINSMHPIALHLNGTAVNPREKAEAALDAVDFALEYSLNEVTRVGAYQMQLEFTEDNLVTENENTTAAVSTIEDTDMAKGMADYTKANVLAQTAQNMLAQANQNMSSGLDLLK